MFGESTFQLNFDGDDDSNGDKKFFDSNQDLPAALDRSHIAVSSAMDKHWPAIALTIVPDAEEPIPSISLPILVEIIDEELPIRPPVSPLRTLQGSSLLPNHRSDLQPDLSSTLRGSLCHLLLGSISPLLQGSPLCRSVGGSLLMNIVSTGR